jgi:putative ABC transport system permease protein
MSAARISAAGAVFAGAIAHNKLGSALAVLAIALGVALGYAVQLITQSAVNELARGTLLLAGDADLQVRGPRRGFDEAIYPQLARLPEVALASPVVEVDAKPAHRDGALPIIGEDLFRAAALSPASRLEAGDPLDALHPDTVFLSPAAAAWLGVGTGDHLQFQVGLGEVSLRVGGLVPAGAQQRFARMDIAGAQTSFDRLGLLSRIDLRLKPGVDASAFRDRLQARLPPGLAAERVQDTLATAAGVSRAYRINMDVLALVALFTGGLLVFSTQVLSVVRRRAYFALLRVLGATRRGLVGLLVAEGALLGAVGSSLGIPLGFLLAYAAVRITGPDLGSGYFAGIPPTLTLVPAALALCFVLGIAVALLGALLPALEAARASPALALHAGDEERAFTRLRSIGPGVALLAAAALCALAPSVAGLPLFGYAAIALLLVGTLLLLPRLVVFLLALLPTPRPAAPQLALAQLRGAPGPVAVALCAIVASLSLMVAMAIMVASFRQALDAWLVGILPADVYVRASASGDSGFMTADDQARIAALPGVQRAEFLREQQLVLDPSRPRVALLARTIDAAEPARRLPLVSPALVPAAGSAPPLWVNETMVDVYGFAPGKVVEIPLAGKSARFTVAGVWRDYARPQGAMVIERERYLALTGDHAATSAALWLTPGTSAEELRRALVADLPGGARLDIASPGEIRAESLHVFDRTFAVTYALELAAVVIGLCGLSSSFGALVLSRRREFGVLRHLGMTRRQIGAMLATEGLLLSGIGLVAGLGVGYVISLILVQVINRQSFHWSMEMSIPWTMLAAAAVVVLLLSTLTALATGRRALAGNLVAAVKDDW